MKMNCLYCKESFETDRKDQVFCCVSCNSKYQSNKNIKFPQLRDKDWLYDQYWNKKISMRDISKTLGCAESCVYKYMEKHKISRRTISEANIGKLKSFNHRINLSNAVKGRWSGKNSPNWKGGLYRKTLEPRFNGGYDYWKKQVTLKYKNKCAMCDRELGNTCECCGQILMKVVHHVKPVKDFPELALDINNGILLCYQCHKNLEKSLKKSGETVKLSKRDNTVLSYTG